MDKQKRDKISFFMLTVKKKKPFKKMSINAINGISLYEYYYKINKDKQDKDKSPIAQEMKEYGLAPTDDESLNIAMLKRAKELQNTSKKGDDDYIPNEDRPWADIMYQLDLSFNENPVDDIDDIKEELQNLMIGVTDDDLIEDIKQLESNVDEMYIDFRNNAAVDITYNTLGMELNNLSMLNRANII